MADDARVPKTQITGIYGGLLKVAMRKMLGQVPEWAEVMWHNPRVFKDLMGFGRKAEKWDRIDPNLASFARWLRPARSAAASAWTLATS